MSVMPNKRYHTPNVGTTAWDPENEASVRVLSILNETVEEAGGIVGDYDPRAPAVEVAYGREMSHKLPKGWTKATPPYLRELIAENDVRTWVLPASRLERTK